MALQGTLDTFALADVLRLLATTAKTGRLRVEGDRGEGSVWLRDGTVMAAAAERTLDDAPSEEVLFELLRFGEGAFAFEIDELSPHGEQPEDVEVLLRDADALLEEWKGLEKVVPSLDHQVTLVASLSGKDVTIDAEHWPSVVAVSSGRSVGELGSVLGLGELGVTRVVRDLVELGIVSVDEPSGPAGTGPRAVEAAPPPDPATRTGPPRLAGRAAGGRHEPALRAEVPSRGEPAARGSRRGPFSSLSSGDALLGSNRDDAATTAEMQRLGWLQSPERTTGSQPAVPAEPDGDHKRAALSGNGNGSASATSAGEASRLSGTESAPKRSSRSASSKRSSGGRGASKRGASAKGGADEPTSGPSSTNGASGTGRLGKGRSGSRRGANRPSSTSSTSSTGEPLGPSVFDTGGTSTPPFGYDPGPVGPTPMPADTGQVRPVSPSALPNDLQWAADDGPGSNGIGPMGRGSNGLGSSGLGANGLGSNGLGGNGLGPTVPSTPGLGSNGLGGNGLGAGPGMPPPTPADPGKVAPHVAAMSPDARAAVQSTVGNSGGSTGAAAGGEDLADRGQLLNFLSSVRA